MKAVVFKAYGLPDVLHLEEVEKPVPKENEVLVKVHAASVNYVDWHVMRGESLLLRLMNGLFRPRHHILGDDAAGRIQAVGEKVKQLQPGDEVLGISDCGAFAEYVCIDQKLIALKPAGMAYETAAALPSAGTTALQALREHGNVQPGSKVLISGASGGVGTFAVQIARAFGAEVTGVCSAGKMELVRSIGADYVLDYTAGDFTRSGKRYDLVVAVAGYRSIFDYKRILSPGGIYVCAGGHAAQYFQGALLGPLISLAGNVKMGSMFTNPDREVFDSLLELIQNESVKPVIDRYYPLEQVPQAMQYYGEGRVKGKIVITVSHGT